MSDQPDTKPPRDQRTTIPGWPAPPRVAWLAAVLALATVTFLAVRGENSGPDRGQLLEPARQLSAGIPLPQLRLATNEWGLESVVLVASEDAMAGGVTLADLDRDGDLDLVAANGHVVVLLWEGTTYGEPRVLGDFNAIAITAADLDSDGQTDLLVATADDRDLIVWGEDWTESASSQVTELIGSGASSNLLVAELSGDDRLDVLRLGRGSESPVPDVLWIAQGERVFSPRELPRPDRFSLAAEIVDVDLDGLLDLWIGRDVGWDRGGDSVLSRQGAPDGPWVDIADDLGVGLEVDAMGITLADLDGDGISDAYVSDLGDNEVLLRDGVSFVSSVGSGAGRIRPPGTEADVVSSSWASGATDINLDGRLDLVVVGGGFVSGKLRNKIEGTEVALAEPPAVLLGNGRGQFVDVWSQLGIELSATARGLTIGDIDGDGDEDFVVASRDGRLHAIRNETIGATMTVRAEAHCPTTGASVVVQSAAGVVQLLLAAHTYGGQHAPTIIVGVPPSSAIEEPEGAAGVAGEMGIESEMEVELTGPDGSVSRQRVMVGPGTRPTVTFGC